ncbi:MAG TPA: copper resistance protein NlpE N-terminal domain-containing protein [Burkholderiales bacterium]
MKGLPGGTALLCLAAAACSTTQAPGTYAAVLPAADAGERHVRVTLKPDGSGALSSSLSERPNRLLAEGTWLRDGNRITLTLNQKQLVFQLAGDQLIAREWDRAEWGEKGPGALFRVDR